MSGLLWLDWAMLAVSLFNTLLLLWLGLTVLLNAERRVWGIWLSAAGLLLGAIFFLSHSAILGSGYSALTPGLSFWWRLGWIPVAALPFMWYLVVLWYAGYWDRAGGKDAGRNQLHQRHHIWFGVVVLCGLMLVGLLSFANPLPSLSELAESRLGTAPSIVDIPALILAYPLYTLLCMGLAMDALRHPEISGRLMGDLARARAHRWLTATSLVLLAVSLLVGWVMIWIMNNAWRGIFNKQLIVTVGLFDLAIAGLIALSVLLLGQAIVAYEVFTGRTLPRRGLAQYWHRAVLLAACFSVLVSGSLTTGLRPIYTLLLTAILMIVFLALLAWRAYAERKRMIEYLRPFAASQRFIDSFLQPEPATKYGDDEQTPAAFQALCTNVLDTRRAGMFPYGSFALLAGPALFYPPASPFEPPDLETIVSRLKETDKIGLSLEPKEMDGLVFVVPLWREAGLSGVILLGSKQDGGPYTQEEIEIAQATGERLIDGQASVEMTRRLIALQRRHLVAGQVADQRVRRLVHDETLPLVHTVMLTLAGGDAVTSIDTQVLEMLEKVHRQLSTLLQSIPVAMAPEVEQDGLVVALQHIVGDELRGAFDEVKWQIDPKAEEQARALAPLSAEVFYSAAREGIRNAARHGRGEDDQSQLCLRIAIEIDGEDTLRLTLEDNGVGLSDRYAKDTHPLQLFHEGLRGVELHNQPGDLGRGGEDPPGEERAIRAGSGQGLVLHSTLMAVIGGSLTLSSRPGVSTCLTLELPRAAGAK